MNKSQINRLQQTEDKLGLKFPPALFSFISTLDNPEVNFGNEEWLVWTLADEADNIILETSLDFKNEWGLNGLVFATNGIGDYLVVLPDKFGEKVLVIMHETTELKLFGDSIDEIVENGPENYFWSDDYIFKLDDRNHFERDAKDNSEDFSDEVEIDDDEDKLRSYLDDLIDDQRTEKTSEIVSGLEKLVDSSDVSNKIWALNKLSDIYLKGFGPIHNNITTALEFNQRAIDLDSHKALSNRSACYFFGLGVDKDIEKALDLATKANELSKANRFADILASKKGGGMYDKLVDMIETEIKKQKKKGC